LIDVHLNYDKWKPRNVRECEGINLHTPKGAPTLGVGILVDSRIFKERLKGSKPNGLKSSSYHWKVLVTSMFKMGSHDPFGHLKHKLWRATYRWKAFHKGYNFALYLISIGVLHTKLWTPKVARIPTMGILGLSGQNDIWVLVPWIGTIYTIRGKVVASPKSERGESYESEFAHGLF